MVYIGFYGRLVVFSRSVYRRDNTKMPKNRLPAQPLWRTLTVNDKKSVFVPTQKLEFMGFILDSLLMTITLTARQKVALLNACSILLQKSHHKIRVVSTVSGMIIAGHCWG